MGEAPCIVDAYATEFDDEENQPAVTVGRAAGDEDMIGAQVGDSGLGAVDFITPIDAPGGEQETFDLAATDSFAQRQQFVAGYFGVSG